MEGLGFAIPVDRVAQVAQDLIQYGFVQDRPWLGIVVQNPPEGSSQTGLLVLEVSPGSAAEQAGLQAGDWLTAFNGVSARSSEGPVRRGRYRDADGAAGRRGAFPDLSAGRDAGGRRKVKAFSNLMEKFQQLFTIP